tara:strand:- start:2199 stop:2657 length:459 start_codon:yes stop_codon:yes gene_type:complete
MMDDYINYLVSVGADKIPHYHEGDSLLSHCIRVSGMLYSYGRPMYEVRAGLFHSVYGTEFQMYQINATRNEICDIIGEDAEHIVNTFCTLTDRVNTILYARGLNDPEKTSLRWLEYCNIRDHDPEASILKEFELVLQIGDNDQSRREVPQLS